VSALAPGVARARRICGLAAVALVGFLAAAEKPWRVSGGAVFFGPPDRPLADTVAVALWWAAGVNAIVCLLLAGCAQLWAAPGAPPPAPSPAARRARAAGFALLLAAATALGGGLRWHLAGTGLWSDEAWSLRQVISGAARPTRDGGERLIVRRVPWRSTLWRYEEPTNQVLSSVAGRLSLAAWRRLAGADVPAFDERALRLPALGAALLSIPLLALLLREWGFARAGVAAALLLALHPWHVRWGATGRGYAFVMLFAIAAALALSRALRTGSGRALALYAGALALMLWSHALSLWLALALGAAGLAAAAAGAGPARERRVRAARLAVANLVAGMLLFQVMAPNIAQLRGWQDSFVGEHERARLTLPALGHLWSFLATGMPAREPEVPERRPGAYPSLADQAERHPWVYAVVLGLLPLLAAGGLWRAAAAGGPARAVALGLAAGVPLALLASLAVSGIWYARFGLYALPAVVAFLALGLDGALARVRWPSTGARRLGAAGGLALGLAGFQALVWPETAVLLARPHQPSREVAALLAREAGGEPGSALRAGFSNVDGGILLATYLPWLRDPANAEEVAALCAEARETGKPLLLAWGHPARHRRKHPELFRWLDDPALFEELATFDAVEVEHLMRVVRYTGAPLPRSGP
jgi:hypothetical protein